MSSVEFIQGPPVIGLSREAAERGLQGHPAIRKGASYAIEPMGDHWVAAIVHESGPPFGGGDDEEESPAPQSEGPSPDESAGPPSPDSGGEDSGGDPDAGDGPPKEKGDKGGEKGEIHQVLDMLQQIGQALGIPLGMGDSMVPGADPMAGPPGPPGMGGPPGAGGPPGMGGGPDVKMHERAMKPGETPPGGTPLGAPAFASVRADHPWSHMAGKVASFRVSKPIGDSSMEIVAREVTALADEIGYNAMVREDRDSAGNRVATALITTH